MADKKLIYKIIAQDASVTMTAKTASEVTVDEAVTIATRDLGLPHPGTRGFVLLPAGTANGYKYGHINFCPRCGEYIGDEMGDSSEIVNNSQTFDCPECDANVTVEINGTPEEDEDDEYGEQEAAEHKAAEEW